MHNNISNTVRVLALVALATAPAALLAADLKVGVVNVRQLMEDSPQARTGPWGVLGAAEGTEVMAKLPLRRSTPFSLKAAMDPQVIEFATRSDEAFSFPATFSCRRSPSRRAPSP